nr:NAD(P)-binding domain-containing protein [Listeria floridensis]
MKINTIGLGYIGLPTSLMFAKHGVNVVGVDISETLVDELNQGQVSIKEPGVADYLTKALEEKRFRASLKPESGDAFIIAVPTPNSADQFESCDIRYLVQALQAVLPVVRAGNTIIIESTIAPRTMEDVIQPFFETAGFTIGRDLFFGALSRKSIARKNTRRTCSK